MKNRGQSRKTRRWIPNAYPIISDSQGGYGGSKEAETAFRHTMSVSEASVRVGDVLAGYENDPIGGNRYYDGDMRGASAG